MKPRPQPPYARFNQPPRSPNGRNRSTPTKNHSDPLDGAGTSAGGATKVITGKSGVTATWRTINSPVLPFDPGVSPNLSLLQATLDMQKQMIAQLYALPGGITYVGIDPIASPPPIPYTGIRSGEITGHRAWLVTDTYELTSLAHYFVWEPGKTIEGDINKRVYNGMGMIPDLFGGVYAYSSFDHLRDDELVSAAGNAHNFPYQERINLPNSISVHLNIPVYEVEDITATCVTVTYLGLAFGTVKLWGETVEHEKGYRASFAKLVSIDGFIGVKGFDLAKLQRKYAVYQPSTCLKYRMSDGDWKCDNCQAIWTEMSVQAGYNPSQCKAKS